MTATAPDPNMSPPPRKEQYEVVMLKNGVSELDAKPDDFKRIPIEATDPLAAIMADTVLLEKEHRALFAAPPGVRTDPEILAHQRQLAAGSQTDKSKV